MKILSPSLWAVYFSYDWGLDWIFIGAYLSEREALDHKAEIMAKSKAYANDITVTVRRYKVTHDLQSG